MKASRLSLLAFLTCMSAWTAAQSPRTFDLAAVPKGQPWRLSGRTISIVGEGFGGHFANLRVTPKQ